MDLIEVVYRNVGQAYRNIGNLTTGYTTYETVFLLLPATITVYQISREGQTLSLWQNSDQLSLVDVLHRSERAHECTIHVPPGRECSTTPLLWEKLKKNLPILWPMGPQGSHQAIPLGGLLPTNSLVGTPSSSRYHTMPHVPYGQPSHQPITRQN